jgi:hypothetical protein
MTDIGTRQTFAHSIKLVPSRLEWGREKSEKVYKMEGEFYTVLHLLKIWREENGNPL